MGTFEGSIKGEEANKKELARVSVALLSPSMFPLYGVSAL